MSMRRFGLKSKIICSEFLVGEKIWDGEIKSQIPILPEQTLE